ncbi:MAG: TrkA C-terminal domain-containing protein [Halobacteriales archaeon]|nr:TrkA C-terminal domain-containing protein [Halobacteriales archaeon]
MAALPVEVLLGVYLGLLTGIIPAMVAWTLGFLFKYFTGVSVPALAVVVLGVAIAGVNGGLLALVDPSISTLPHSERVLVAILVVMMMSLYAHAQGDRLGASAPRRLSLKRLRERTLSADVVELVGGRGQVRVTVAGEVGDIEGYPPLGPDDRAAIRAGEWPFPADLPLVEIESRLEDRLRTTYGLAEVDVTLDDQGRAHVAAASASHGVSARVPPGRRAVSIGALVPSGVARGDEVTIALPDGLVEGTVVSARSDIGDTTAAESGAQADPESTEPGDREPAVQPRAATTTGGEGRVTVAVDRRDAERLLRADRARVLVTSKGVRGEFELLGLLRRAGARLRRLPIAEGSELAGRTLADAAVRDDYGVEVLAVRTDGRWTVAPAGDTDLPPGGEAFVVGRDDGVRRFGEASS